MRRAFIIAMGCLMAAPAISRAHFGQRVWVDVGATNQIQTYIGPPGDGPPLSAGQFSLGRVFARDMGDNADINYTALLKPYPTYGSPSLIPSDGDVDDDGLSYATDFPGYELKPFSSFASSATFNLSIVGQPLYYEKATLTSPAQFLPVSTAFAGKILPYFTVGATVRDPITGINYFQEGRSPTDGSVVFACPAFSVGGHGHPDVSLFPNVDDPGSALDITDYQGVYALGLRLDAPGLLSSQTFYEVLGNEASQSEILDAARLANDTFAAVPEPGSVGLLLAGSCLLMRRRPRNK